MTTLLLAVLVSICTLSEATSVWGLISNNASFTRLASMLETDGYDGTLDDPSNVFTLLAPVNSGFNGTVSSATLLNHVIHGSYPSSLFSQNGFQLKNTENSASFLLAFRTPELTFCSKTCSKVTRKDIEASNGYVHVLENEILPAVNRTVIELIKSDPRDFSTLMHALIATHLQYSLLDPGAHVTVFAPTTAAFNASFTPEQIQCLYRRIHQKDLITIILNHVMGDIIPSFQFKTGNLTSLANIPVRMDVTNTGVFLNGNITITKTDTFGLNGVIHTINRVMVPHLESTCLY